jgi:predicted nucleotidyltransferase
MVAGVRAAGVDPTPKTSLLDIGAIRHELRELLGVKVDVLTPGARRYTDGMARRAEIFADTFPPP